jgi:hypothetical protein
VGVIEDAPTNEHCFWGSSANERLLLEFSKARRGCLYLTRGVNSHKVTAVGMIIPIAYMTSRLSTVNSIPRKWTPEMDKLDFDPAEHTLNKVVLFCERMEVAEEQDHSPDKKPTAKSCVVSNKKGKTESSGKKDRMCMYHGPNTHPTPEC